MNILVTGASGYIGGKLIEQLCGRTWVSQVIGTDIQPSGFRHDKFSFYERDVRHSMDDLFSEHAVEAVIHTAYVLTPIHNKVVMEEINKGGTHNVLEAAARTGVKQVVYTSSTTAYGFYPDNDVPLTEDSPLRGNEDLTYAKNKKEIEFMIDGFRKDHPEMIVTVLRPCFVVGPGFQNPMAEHLQKKFVFIPANHCPFQFVHETDLINVLLLLLEKGIGGAFNVTGEDTMTFPEMIAMLGNTAVPLPWRLLYPLNNLAWHLRLTGVTRFPSPAMRLMVQPWIASSEKLRQALDYLFQYDTRSAFADFVDHVKGW